MRNLIIRIDDVHPKMNWENFKYLTGGMLNKNQTGLLGVIPDCKDPKLEHGKYQSDFWDYIRFLKSKGWTISQHGYQHVYDTQGKSILAGEDQSEFSTHDYKTQAMKIKLGKSILAKKGLSTDIFMAPGHHFDDITLTALKDSGFNYLTDGYAFYPFKFGSTGLKFVPQLFARAHGLPFGIYTTCCHLDNMDIKQIDNFLDEILKFNIVSFEDAARHEHPFGTESLSRKTAELLIYLYRKFGKIKSKLRNYKRNKND